MQAFSYVAVNGHGVAHINGRKFLIDLGLSYSIAQRPMLIDGQRIGVEPQVNGLTTQAFSDQLGVDLDGVLGANLSSEFVVSILPRARSIIFDHSLSEFPINVEADNVGGIAAIGASVGGKQLRGFLDLGNSLSLIRADQVGAYEAVDTDTAVFSFVGAAEVKVYELPVMLGDKVIYLRFGAMPPKYAQWLEMVNIQVVLGHELLKHFAVSLAVEEGIVSFDPLVN